MAEISRLGQRNDHALAIEVLNDCVDALVKRADVGESLMGDVAGFGLLFAQLQTQTDPIDLAGRLPPFQGAPRPPVAEFFRNDLDSCDRLMRTPSRASTSARRRAIVEFGRSATGSSSRGMTTRSAVELFTGSGPGATLAFSASTPPLPKSLRHSRTVSPRTPNGSAIRGLVHPPSRAWSPASVSSTARALSASPAVKRPGKSRQSNALDIARSNRRFSAHVAPIRIGADSESETARWSINRNLLKTKMWPIGWRLRRKRQLANCEWSPPRPRQIPEQRR
jgi:hypothetical protein